MTAKDLCLERVGWEAGGAHERARAGGHRPSAMPPASVGTGPQVLVTYIMGSVLSQHSEMPQT
jgi:hypothetical protein